jgi:phospholipid-binding lipoprotein MlaA
MRHTVPRANVRTLGAALLLCAAVPIWGASPAEARTAGSESSAVAPDPLFEDDLVEAGAAGATRSLLESVNRRTLRINQGLDRWLLNPVTRTYGFVVPGPVKACIRRAFANLNSPSIVINDLLQREWRDAGITFARFAVNSTAGVGGLFDPAERLGWQAHDSDFGQTLALTGVGAGPFLVLPALGPTTIRDGFGAVVDFFLNPGTYILGPAIQLLAGGGSGLASREANLQGLEALEQSSVDYYAALRSAYLQNREAQIWTRRAHHREVTTVAQATGRTGARGRVSRNTTTAANRPTRSWRHRGPFG